MPVFRVLVVGVALWSFIGCKQPKEVVVAPVAPKLDVRKEFEAELQRRSFTFSRLPDGRYEVASAKLKASEFKLTVSIENLTKDVERDGDRGAITRFVDRFEQIPDAKLTWDVARSRLRFSVEPNDYDEATLASALQHPTSKMTMLVLTVVNPSTGDVRWVAAKDLEDWGVTRAEAERIAYANLDALLEGKQPNVSDVRGKKLGMLPLPEESKASAIFAPHFRQYIEPLMGWPVLAVTPCRDFVYVFSKDDFDLVGQAGATVLHEFETSGYPVTTEVWEISDAGVVARGSLGEPKKPTHPKK